MPNSNQKPPRKFSVDAKAVLTLGRNSIKDHATAVVELIKNSYDADADTVDLKISSSEGRIRISDNGHGMSEKDLEDNWLRIGYSEKVANKTTSGFRRRKTGEKGIGRLSADRLGANLELRSRAQNNRPVGVLVDWNEFEKPGRDVADIELLELDDPLPTIPKRRTGGRSGLGTELVISNLRQEWTDSDIERLHEELTLLLPPYPQLSKNFQLNFENDVSPDLDGPIQYGKNLIGEIEFIGKLTPTGILRYKLSFRDPQNRARRKSENASIDWQQLAPGSGSSTLRSKSQLGPLDIRLSYFVRRADLLEGTGLALSQLREFLDRNAGVKIYRDMVRVKPYGDPATPDADWLGLSDRKLRAPDAATRSNFKVAANQMVGAIFIGRDENRGLVDSSSREGLIENDAFKQLRTVLMRSISRIEAKYHELSINSEKAEKTATGKAKAAVKNLSTNLSTLSVELKDLKKRVSGGRGINVPMLQQIELVLEQVQTATKEIDEIADQNTVYRGLATVGIASAVFGHETEMAISQARQKLSNASKLLGKTPPQVAKSIERLSEADEYMDRIASWGKFALSRVNKDKRQRRRVDVGNLIMPILDGLQLPMEKSGILLKRNIRTDVNAKTFPMDVEAVLINFLTNAYHEVKRKDSGRVIQVKLGSKKQNNKDGFELSVLDSGMGISDKDLPAIWQPLFSTKVDESGRMSGTGLGLAIVKSAVEELDGTVAAHGKSSLGGAAFSAWFPKGI